MRKWLIRFQLWWYEYTLTKRFNNNNKWEINPTFIKTLVTQFKSTWLSDYNSPIGYETILVLYYTKLPFLINALKDMITQIKKDKEITLVTVQYNSRPSPYHLSEYLVDEKHVPYNIISLEQDLKKLVIELITEMELANLRSDIQYSYYLRVTKMVISDILELYWGFFEIANKTVKRG